MPHYKYLIVGGGMTADAAAQGIREADPQGSIGLIGAETHPPYDRPPLSKGLWKGKPLDAIWRSTLDRRVGFHLGRRATHLDLNNRQVTDDQGNTYTFDKLLLATGGTPRTLPFGAQEIIYYRTLDDYRRLRQLAGDGVRFGVIGGSFIGSEIAAALAMNGQEVVMIFPEQGICGLMFPPDLSKNLNEYYRQKGVEVLAGEFVEGLERRGDKIQMKTSGGKEVAVDHVVAGIGITPNTQLAEEAGLEVQDGILVDEYLRAGHPDLYAAGDVANFYNPSLGHRLRVEHEDNANTMGKVAGQNMAGQETPYHHLPYFYSDLFELGYEAVGDMDPRLEIVADWQETYRKGVVYYLKDGRVRGALLWDVWGQVDAARQLIAEPGPFKAKDLKGRIPG